MTAIFVVGLGELDRGPAAEEVETEHADVLGLFLAPFLTCPALSGVRVERERVSVVRGVGEEALELVGAGAGRWDGVGEGRVPWRAVGLGCVLGVGVGVLEAGETGGDGGMEGVGPGELHVRHAGSETSEC